MIDGSPSDYDREYALLAQWERLEKYHGANTGEALLKAVARELDKRGTLAVLRGEVKDRGARVKLCRLKPDHAMNPDASRRYACNRRAWCPNSCTRRTFPSTAREARNGASIAQCEFKEKKDDQGS